jgi:MSHA pilin protein MshC
VAAFSTSGQSARGYTLVELVVVLILVGILGAVGAARFFNRTPFDTRNFADQAGAALRFAQKVAVAQNRMVYVVTDSNTIRLCFAAGATCAATNQVQAPFSVKTDSTCTSVTWYCLRRPTGVTLGYSGTVAFNALGRPFDASGTALPTAVAIPISGTGSSYTVTVEPETGYVH